MVNDDLYKTDDQKEELLFKTFFDSESLNSDDYDSTHADLVEDEYETIFSRPVRNLSNDPLSSGYGDLLNQPVREEELQNAILGVKTEGKCSDAESVNPVMMTHLGPIAKDLLIRAFNWCLATGEWIWTHSEVCFIRKPDKNSYLDPGSYRPITISSYIGKLLEKIIEKRLRGFYEITELFDETQEGFCPNRSTSRYLYKLMSQLNEAKRKKLNAMILFIDFSKAFDSVWARGS